MRTLCGLLFGIAALLLAATPALGDLEGRFEAIGPVPAEDSLETVVFEEYLNFTCPHCNNFRKAAKPLFDKYGEQVRHVRVPILFRGQQDHVIRLYYIAEREGQAERVKDMIFDAVFQYGVNINDPAVVNYLARSAGLGDAYQEQREQDWVDRKVRESRERAAAAGVRATPTVVLQGALKLTPERGMDAYVNNLDSLIGQLLASQ